MNQIRAIVCMLLALSSVIPFAGCTAIGFVIGSAIDEGHRGGPHVSDMKEIQKLNPGQSVTVVQTNGDSIEGRYCGILARPTEEYASLFAQFAHSLNGGTFPASLGETIKIVTDQEGEAGVVRGKFNGFDPNCIYIQTTDADRGEKIPIPSIVSIVDTARRVVGGNVIRDIVKQSKLPCLSALTIVRGNDTLRIPIQEVVGLETPGGYHAKYIGLGVGAAVDIVLAVMFGKGMPSWK